MDKTRNEEDIKEVGEALEVTFRILIQGAGGLQLTFFFSFNYQEKTKSYKTCSQWFTEVLDACLVIYLQKMNPSTLLQSMSAIISAKQVHGVVQQSSLLLLWHASCLLGLLLYQIPGFQLGYRASLTAASLAFVCWRSESIAMVRMIFVM